MKYITVLITLPLTVLMGFFVLSNTAKTSVFLYPDSPGYSLSVGMLGLVMLGTGFFFGALFVWIHDQKIRIKGWKDKKRADRLEKELDTLQKKIETLEPKTDQLQLSKMPGRFSFLTGRRS